MAEAPDTLTITVDGKEVLAHAGEMIIAAAERAGVYIPRFCYHPRMRPVGMCRMCLVDIKGPRGFSLQPACFLPVAEGQEVCTTSAAVNKARDGVLEFLLVNHPLDCPVCDKGGECPLQDQTLTYGPGESRFVEEKRHWEKPIPLSSLVYLDRERCIQCDRCTRFADEVAGDPLIDFVGRGDHTEVNTFPDLPFASYFSGNTVQICPVGALTATPYRFRARPWDLEQVESTCTTCAVGCRVAVQSSSNRLTRYLGIDSDPVNHGWLCDKGRFAFEAVNGHERLSHPLVRQAGELVPASWGEALEAAAKALRDVRALHGPESIAVLGGARLANEDAYAWAKLAKSVIGTDSVDAQLGDGLPAEAILGLPRATIDQACRAGAVVLLGPDLKEELPILYLRLRAAIVDGGVPLVEMVPASGGLTRYAAAALRYRPGEAAELARALVGAQAPRDPVAGTAPAELARARRVLEDAQGDVVVILGRPSVADSGEAVVDAAAVLAEGLPGVRFLPALRRGNVHGALDMGLAPGILPGRVALDEGREWWSQAWGVIPEERGLDAAGVLTAAEEGRLQALVLLGADPLTDFPDSERARRGLFGAGFVLAVDAYLTESCKHAQVVLPSAAYAERPGTTTNLEGRITRLGQKIVPPGVAWPDWMIASELALRVGGDLGFDGIEGIWEEIERYAPSHAGITRRLLSSPLARDGVVAPLAEETATRIVPGTGRPGGGPELLELAPDTGGATQPVPAPIDPMSDPGIDAAESQGISATEVVPEPAASPGEGDGGAGVARPDLGAPPPQVRYRGGGPVRGLPKLDSYSLRLVSGRSLYDQGVAVQRSPSLAGLTPTPRLRANPYDLDRLGVTTGDRVRLRSGRASFVLEAVADAGVPPGSAALPFNLAEQSAGELIDGSAPVAEVRLETL